VLCAVSGEQQDDLKPLARLGDLEQVMPASLSVLKLKRPCRSIRATCAAGSACNCDAPRRK
jgi:hypothetical protein